jgi:hypothetical protein
VPSRGQLRACRAFSDATGPGCSRAGQVAGEEMWKGAGGVERGLGRASFLSGVVWSMAGALCLLPRLCCAKRLSGCLPQAPRAHQVQFPLWMSWVSNACPKLALGGHLVSVGSVGSWSTRKGFAYCVPPTAEQGKCPPGNTCSVTPRPTALQGRGGRCVIQRSPVTLSLPFPITLLWPCHLL